MVMDSKRQNFLEDLLGSMRRDEKYSDFVLKVDGEDIPVHRNILSAASPYFEAMLSSDTIERKRGCAEIFDLDPGAVKTCIDFIYSGKAKLSLENPEHLIQASDLMQIPQLKEMYFKFLIDNVTTKVCLKYAVLASKYHVNTSSVTLLQSYVIKNVEKILDSQCMSGQSKEEFFQVLDMFPEDLLNREVRKWRAIETWVKADVENRRGWFVDLFKLLQLDEIPLECLAKDILMSQFVKEFVACRDAIMASLSLVKQRPLSLAVAAPKEKQVTTFPVIEPLPPYTKKPTHVAAFNVESSMLHAMNLSTLAWSRYARLPCKLNLHSILSIRGEVYVRCEYGSLRRYSGGNWERLCNLE